MGQGHPRLIDLYSQFLHSTKPLWCESIGLSTLSAMGKATNLSDTSLSVHSAEDDDDGFLRYSR